MVTMLDFGLEDTSSILEEIIPYFFFNFFSSTFLYHAGNIDTKDDQQHMSSAGQVLRGYNAMHTCCESAEQEASRLCGSLPTLYCCGFLLMRSCFFYRTLHSVKLKVSTAVV